MLSSESFASVSIESVANTLERISDIFSSLRISPPSKVSRSAKNNAHDVNAIDESKRRTKNTFDKALKAFQTKYNIVNEEGIYDKTTADLLQGLSMDLHFEVYEKDVIEQIKELYGSKKI